jgi:hypothetical protein
MKPQSESQTIITTPTTYDPLMPTIFHETWWLDIVTDGQYGMTEVNSGGRVVGRMPYYVRSRMGLKIFHMPTLTHFLGPAIDEGQGGRNARFLKRLAITRELIEQLPPIDSLKVKCHRQVPEVIAFQEMGFRTSIQFVNEIPVQDTEISWKSLRDKTRNVIRRAEEQYTAVDLNDCDKYLAFYNRNLHEAGKTNHFNLSICRRLITSCLEQKRGRIFAARDASNNLAAAIFCVFDDSASYYLMSTRTQSSGNGAISMLLWQAIKDAAERGIAFDMDGIGNKGDIHLFSGFSAHITPRYVVSKAILPLRIARELGLLSWERGAYY